MIWDLGGGFRQSSRLNRQRRGFRSTCDVGYYVMGKVDGVPVRFLVHTGASGVVLSPDDARRLGISPPALKFDRAYETANGVGLGAPVGPKRVEVGPIRFDDVTVEVN